VSNGKWHDMITTELETKQEKWIHFKSIRFKDRFAIQSRISRCLITIGLCNKLLHMLP